MDIGYTLEIQGLKSSSHIQSATFLIFSLVNSILVDLMSEGMEACELDKLKSSLQESLSNQRTTCNLHQAVNKSTCALFPSATIFGKSPGKTYPAHEQKECQANLALETFEPPEERQNANMLISGYLMVKN